MVIYNLVKYMLYFSVKLFILIQWIFKCSMVLFPDELFGILFEMVNDIQHAYNQWYHKQNNYHSNKIINVTMWSPNKTICITNSFKIYLLFDKQDNGFFNIEKVINMYAQLIVKPHCILMISYEFNCELKTVTVNLITHRIIKNTVEYKPNYNVCGL